MSHVAAEPLLRIRALGGSEVAAPREWEPMLVEALIPPDEWQRASLHVNGRRVPLSLREIATGVRVIGDWERRGPGHYRVALDSPSLRGTTMLTVESSKLPSAELTQLLEDLEARLPASIAIGLQRTGGLVGAVPAPSRPSTLAGELARLRKRLWGRMVSQVLRLC